MKAGICEILFICIFVSNEDVLLDALRVLKDILTLICYFEIEASL